MKKAVIFCLVILSVACKKTNTQPQNKIQSSVGGLNKGKITVIINSNNNYPLVTILNSSMAKKIKQYNNGYQTGNIHTPVQIQYSFNTLDTGKYSLSVVTGTTNMLDTNQVWHTMKVIYNDSINLIDTINIDSKNLAKTCQTSFYFHITQ